jgi:serine/threonine-protein kinase
MELLGRGGMGEVWRAYDTAHNNRIVAIKLLPPHLAGDSTFVHRFRREADAAAQLNNPHIIPIHSYGDIDGRLYVDMRLVEGRDLQEVLADGPLEPARAVRIIEQVAKALQAAHKIGLVHRDVKPSNILLDEDDFAYLIDFGIARGADETGLTGTGAMIGSWHYMAPERLRAHEADARADIYALACVLYECLTGQRPFPGDSLESQIAAHLTDPPPQPSTTKTNVPAQFDAVIAKGMAKEPNQRYSTTIELADAARDAITVPVPRPATAPTLLARTEQPGNRVIAQPTTAKAESPTPAKPAPALPHSQSKTPPSAQPAPLLPGTSPPPGAVKPGWYPDPAGTGLYRYWNGKKWSDLPPRPRPPASPAKTQRPATKPTSGRRLSRRSTVALAVGAVVLIIAIVALVDVVSKTHQSKSYAPQVVLPFTCPYGEATDTRPVGVAVDSAGDLYVVDLVCVVAKLVAGSTTQDVLPFSGLDYPEGVAVDSAGNVYVADSGNNRVLKLAAGSSTQSVLPLTGLKGPSGVAVDAARNLYVTDTDNNRVLMLAAGSTTQDVLPFSDLRYPEGVAVDSAGNVYVADAYKSWVLKLAAR